MKPLTAEQIREMVLAIERTREHEFNCEQCQNYVSEFAERRMAGLPLDEILAQVEHHLSLCPDCTEQFLALEKILREGS